MPFGPGAIDTLALESGFTDAEIFRCVRSAKIFGHHLSFDQCPESVRTRIVPAGKQRRQMMIYGEIVGGGRDRMIRTNLHWYYKNRVRPLVKCMILNYYLGRTLFPPFLASGGRMNIAIRSIAKADNWPCCPIVSPIASAFASIEALTDSTLG